MKLFGKFFRRPEENVTDGVPAKKASTNVAKAKSLLLRTYFTSLLCLVLCVAMFLGTSYAWFTSEVNNASNEIYVGLLKVGLFKETADGPADLTTGDTKLFNSNICWEPGYTTIETIQVVNKGNLAFKYVLTFADGTLETANASVLEDVADCFEVWVFNHLHKTYTPPTSYDEGIVENPDWVLVGTLADVLAGKDVLSGVMVTVRQENQDPTVVNEGTVDGVSTVDRFTIALHMKETASAEVMGNKILLNVKLMAYQLTSEQDVFGNAAYDEDLVAAATAKDLKAVLTNGKKVVLASDVSLATAEEALVMRGGMLDGNGKTITYEGEKVNNGSVGVLTVSGGEIANLTVNGNANGRALYITKLTSDLLVTDCTLSGAYSFNLNSAVKNEDAIIQFVNTNLTSWTSYANVANHVYFTGCVFNNVLKPYGDTTLTDCTFTTTGLDLSALEAGETLTMINCTYKGQQIEKAVFTNDGEMITLSENTAIMLDANNRVTLANS